MKLVVAALLFSSMSWAQIGTVKLVRGQVTNAQGKPLAVNDKVSVGEVIHTKDKSFVRIKLEDDVAFQAGPNSSVKIERNDKEGITTLNLQRGEVYSRIKPKPTEQERFRVKTPMAVMGVRGTTFFTSSQSDKATHLCVCEGKVAVTWKGATKLVQTKHHDAPTLLTDKWTAVSNFPAHTDEEAAELDQLLQAP